uniref:Uncharacterized protein n=1 Tax=Glossina palpalis gambiensis TaxID=67801 RepID=A0A1B0BLQ6_9MUSC
MTTENIMKSEFMAALKMVSAINLSSNKTQNQFDFNALKKEFAKACPDFNAVLTEESRSQALEFAADTTYRMVPSITTAKKYGRTLVHRFSFTKEAKVLIALDFCTKQPRFEDVETKQDKASVLISVIQSCQSGGEYLEMSQASIALVASVCATKYIRNERLRNKIISRTYKQYAAVGKQIDEETFWIYARNTFAIEHEWTDELIRIFDEGKIVRYFGKNSVTAKVETKESTSAAEIEPKESNSADAAAKENSSVVDAISKATRKISITGQFESDFSKTEEDYIKQVYFNSKTFEKVW